MTETLATWGGWERTIRDDPFDHFAQARAQCPVRRMRLADGTPANAGSHKISSGRLIPGAFTRRSLGVRDSRASRAPHR